MKADATTILKLQLKAIPESLRSAVTAPDLAVKIKTIADRYGIRSDQGIVLENEIAMVLLGVAPVTEFSQSLQKEASIQASTADSIARGVDQSIFAPVRSYLMEAERHLPTVAPETPPPQVMPPVPPLAKLRPDAPPPMAGVPVGGAVPAPPPKPPSPPVSIHDSKLTQSTHVPTEVVDVTKKPVNPLASQPKVYGEGDPYRETVE